MNSGSTLRLLVALGLSGGILLEERLAMSPYTVWGLSLPVLLWCARPFHEGLLRAFRLQRANTDMLISVSVWSAFIYSTVAVFAPGALLPGAQDHRLGTLCALVVGAVLGRWLDIRLLERSGEAWGKLVRRIPHTARVVTTRGPSPLASPSERLGSERAAAGPSSNGAKHVPSREVKRGKLVLVMPGEQIPVDGRVREGASHVDESIWTGSDALVEKTVGSRVLAGTQNKDGRLVLEVSRDGVNSSLASVVRGVEGGFGLKAVRAGIADGLARGYVPAVVITAVGAALLWSWQGPEPRLAHAFTALAMILIASCPWTLTAASPVALALGLRRAARMRIRIRNPRVLEKLDRVDALVLDKTGVLTEGRPEVGEVLCFGSWTQEDLLSRAAIVERRTGHPFAAALSRRLGGEPVPEAQSRETYPGQGVSVRFGDDHILAGSLPWLAGQGVVIPEPETKRLARCGDSLMAMAVGGRFAGAVTFKDAVRPGVREALKDLEAEGIEVVLASGDSNGAAHKVAEAVGIRRVYAEVLEEDKVDIVRQLQVQGKKVVMVGDGKRDAAALSRADLGICVAVESDQGEAVPARGASALGAGIDLAAEAADIVLQKRDLEHLLDAIRLSLKMREVIRENLKWVFGLQICLLPAAAGAYYASFSSAFPPEALGAASAAGLAAILLHSIKRFKEKDHGKAKAREV